MHFYISGERVEEDTFAGLFGEQNHTSGDKSNYVIQYIAVYVECRLICRYFIVLKATQNLNERWLSINKLDTGIEIGIFDSKEAAIKLDGKGNARTGWSLILLEEQTNNGNHLTIDDLFESLQKDDQRLLGYNIQSNNCEIFSKYVFDKFASIKTFDIKRYSSWPKQILKNTLGPLHGLLILKEWEGFTISYGDKLIGHNLGEVQNALNTLPSNNIENIVDGQMIKCISVYTTPLQGIYSHSPDKVKECLAKQWTSVDYHAFVVLETNDGSFWSVEKQINGIFVNKQSTLEAVRDKFGDVKRSLPVNLVIKDKAKANYHIRGIVDILKYEKEHYDATRDSCQHMAKRLFDKIAIGKTWEFTRPPEYIQQALLFLLMSVILAVVISKLF